jgi:hypothetical protein
MTIDKHSSLQRRSVGDGDQKSLITLKRDDVVDEVAADPNAFRVSNRRRSCRVASSPAAGSSRLNRQPTRVEHIAQLVETNPSNIRTFPTGIRFPPPHGTTLKALIRMFADVR